MDALWIMLKNVIVFVALAVPGFILVKSKMLTQAQSGALSKLLMYVGMPFLILTNIVAKITFNKELLLMMGVVALIGSVYTFAMFFLSKPITAMEKEEKTKGMMRFCSVFSNNGFLGIPLAMAVFGAGSKELMVVIILNIILTAGLTIFFTTKLIAVPTSLITENIIVKTVCKTNNPSSVGSNIFVKLFKPLQKSLILSPIDPLNTV